MFHMAQSGTLDSAMVTRYIANVTYMISASPQATCAALAIARAASVTSLFAAHFEHKLQEEVGHVVWGESDLESLVQMVAAPSNTTATPSIEALADFLTKTIATDPALYLGYLAFTEYVTVLLGPELLSLIDERCGVPRTSMTVIDNHIELDRDHAEEGFGLIDDSSGTRAENCADAGGACRNDGALQPLLRRK